MKQTQSTTPSTRDGLGVNPRKMTTSDVAKNIPNWQARDSELVTGIFKNHEAPGQSVTFNYKAYPGEDYREWHFQDGEKYTIPRGVARHLNTSCYYLEHKHLPDQTGQYGIRQALDGRAPANATMTISTKKYRYAFNSIDFGDDDLELVQSDLAQVSLGK
jgi:hypothetical protein